MGGGLTAPPHPHFFLYRTPLNSQNLRELAGRAGGLQSERPSIRIQGEKRALQRVLVEEGLQRGLHYSWLLNIQNKGLFPGRPLAISTVGKVKDIRNDPLILNNSPAHQKYPSEKRLGV